MQKPCTTVGNILVLLGVKKSEKYSEEQTEIEGLHPLII